MPWARFDERYPSHRKVRPLSDAAFRLDVSAVCWSSEHLTDGFVSTDDLALVSDVKRPKAAANELVKRGRWDEVDGGWAIHDFHIYNPSSDKVRADREAAAERQRRAREAARAAKERRESQGMSQRDSHGSHGERAVPPTRPDPTRPVLVETSPPPSPSVPPEHGGQEHPAATVRAARSAAGLAVDGWTDTACTAAVFAVRDLAQQRQASQDDAWAALAVVARMPDTSHPGRLSHKLHDALDEVSRMRRDAGNARADAAVLTELAQARARAVDPAEVPAWREAREALAARTKRASA